MVNEDEVGYIRTTGRKLAVLQGKHLPGKIVVKHNIFSELDHQHAIRIQALQRGNQSRKVFVDFYKDTEDRKALVGAGFEWLQALCEENIRTHLRKQDHYMDFYKKYDDDDASQPIYPLGKIGTPWCCMFDLMEDESGNLTVLSSECVEICMRLLAADMYLKPHIGLSGKEVYIKIGAPYEILADEAQVFGLRVRLRETKGAVVFNAEYAEYYTPNRFELFDMTALDGTERGHNKCTPFTSGALQVLVDSRMRRVAGLDLETRQFMPTAEDAIQRMKVAIDDHEQIRAHQLMELLTCCGGFRPYVEQVLGAAVRLLAQQCLTGLHSQYNYYHTHIIIATVPDRSARQTPTSSCFLTRGSWTKTK
jgi:hypothetical protein